MTAVPQPHREPAPHDAGDLADATAALGAPPPHLLWATLETAYAPSKPSLPAAKDDRLAPYLALPMAVGLSLVLWVAVVELVLTR